MPSIGITGVTATGKTTLTEYMASEYGFVLLREEFKLVVSTLTALARSPSESTSDASVAATTEWIECRNQTISANNNVVMDRTAIDILKFWLDYARNIPDELFSWPIKLCTDQIALLDLLVVLPIENFTLIPGHNEDNMYRPTSQVRKVRNHAMMIGLSNVLAPNCLLMMPQKKPPKSGSG